MFKWVGTVFLKRVYDSGCALVTMKSIGPEPRDGHNNPTVIDLGHGIINAVGLPTPGYAHMKKEWKDLKKRAFPLSASIYGGSVEEAGRLYDINPKLFKPITKEEEMEAVVWNKE